MNIIKGKISRPQKITIYGVEGVGKTSLGAQFPNPLFLDTERSTGELDVDRLECLVWKDITNAISYLLASKREYQTIVFDTVDAAVTKLTEHVCAEGKMKSIEDFGYGKGHIKVGEEFSRFLIACDKLVDMGYHVLFLGHSHVKTQNPPDAPQGYDRYELKLPKNIASLLKQESNAVLFATYKTTVSEATGKAKGIGGKERILQTTRTAAWDAKNRVELADRIPMTFEALAPLFAVVPPITEVSAPVLEVDATKARPHPLDAVFADRTNEEIQKINAWLVKNKRVAEWQTYKDLPSDKAAAIVSNLAHFLKVTGVTA